MEQVDFLPYTLCLKQLSVACNLILEGVRMITQRWTSSHRCSWMAVYVSCCILLYCPIESHGILMSSIALLCLALSCQLPCYNLFTLHSMFVYLRRTPLVNYGPGPIFTIDTSSTVYLLQTIITFHTIQLILCYSNR